RLVSGRSSVRIRLRAPLRTVRDCTDARSDRFSLSPTRGPYPHKLVVEQVRVHIEPHRRGLVPEHPLHRFHVRSGRHRQRRRRVRAPPPGPPPHPHTTTSPAAPAPPPSPRRRAVGPRPPRSPCRSPGAPPPRAAAGPGGPGRAPPPGAQPEGRGVLLLHREEN